MKFNPLALAAATSLALLAAPAAQTATATGTTTTDPALTTPMVEDDRDDDKDFPWGLLGIIGLAGLLGRKRDDVHVDRTNRTDTNNRM